MDETDSARLFVCVDGEDWLEVRSLADAGPADAVFVVDADEGLFFGDGQRGRRPPDGSVVTVTYREGGGDSDAQVSVTTRWPPPDRSYVVALSSAGVRIGCPGGSKAFPGAC